MKVQSSPVSATTIVHTPIFSSLPLCTKGEDGALPHWAVPPLLVVPVSDSDLGTPLQEVARVEAAAEDPVGGGAGGDGEVEDPRPPLADERFSQAVLDFLTATDVANAG